MIAQIVVKIEQTGIIIVDEVKVAGKKPTKDQIKQAAIALMDNFNRTLRPGESPRILLGVLQPIPYFIPTETKEIVLDIGECPYAEQSNDPTNLFG